MILFYRQVFESWAAFKQLSMSSKTKQACNSHHIPEGLNSRVIMIYTGPT
jgi:hypothetical protein